MQLIHLPPAIGVIISVIVWGVIQSLAVYVSLQMPDRVFSYKAFPYKSRKWEHGGEIYKRIFKVNRWKKFLPDGGSIVKNGYGKKYMLDFSQENLERFLTESCRSEAAHFLAILPFWIFGFFAPGYVVLIMLVYSLAVNLPCIIVQRYNRPRIINTLKMVRGPKKE